MKMAELHSIIILQMICIECRFLTVQWWIKVDLYGLVESLSASITIIPVNYR